MHDRLPTRRRNRATQRERRRLAQREYRRRFNDGRFTVAVEIGGEIVEMLTATGWLKTGESDDRKKIAMAIAAMLSEAAKR